MGVVFSFFTVKLRYIDSGRYWYYLLTSHHKRFEGGYPNMQLIPWFGRDEGAMWGIIFIQPCNLFKKSSFFRAHIWRFLFLYRVKIFELLLSKKLLSNLISVRGFYPIPGGGGNGEFPWAVFSRKEMSNHCQVSPDHKSFFNSHLF